MPAIDNTMQAKYLTRQVVKQRNSVTLVAWAAYRATEPIPATPDDAWIRQRVVAENIPMGLDYIVNSTLAYFLQDPATSDSIRGFISEDNTESEEQTLAQSNDGIVGAFMPRYAQSTVSDQQVEAWRERNNVPAPAKA
jgi:hypothetical protein